MKKSKDKPVNVILILRVRFVKCNSSIDELFVDVELPVLKIPGKTGRDDLRDPLAVRVIRGQLVDILQPIGGLLREQVDF